MYGRNCSAEIYGEQAVRQEGNVKAHLDCTFLLVDSRGLDLQAACSAPQLGVLRTIYSTKKCFPIDNARISGASMMSVML